MVKGQATGVGCNAIDKYADAHEQTQPRKPIIQQPTISANSHLASIIYSFNGLFLQENLAWIIQQYVHDSM